LEITIRQANKEDAEIIATYLLLAMEDIVYEFIGEKNRIKAMEFLVYFTERQNNQYSYQNCLVAEAEGEVVAGANLYDGAKLSEMREPISRYIKTRLNRDFNHEDETQPDENYIDSLAVNPNWQGQGIGTRLLEFLINEYVIKQHGTLGLLVDEENVSAKNIYFKLGFSPAGKKDLAGKKMLHLQLKGSTESSQVFKL